MLERQRKWVNKMFFPGTKIKVLNSTIQSKTGPRKGSIGYVSNADSIRMLKDVQIDGLVAKCSLYFSRFGNQEKERCEKKNVLLFLPTIQYKDKVGDSFIRNSHRIREIVGSMYGEKIHQPIIVPIIDFSHENSTKAFFTSVVKANEIILFLQRIKIAMGGARAEAAIGGEHVVNTIMSCYHGSDKVNEVMEILEIGQINKKELMTSVHKVLVLYKNFHNKQIFMGVTSSPRLLNRSFSSDIISYICKNNFNEGAIKKVATLPKAIKESLGVKTSSKILKGVISFVSSL